MAVMVEGKNGGRIKRRQKGDPAEPGSGRPKGAKSFKTLLAEALEKTIQDEDGKPIKLKELSAIQMVSLLLSSETEDNTKLKAFQVIRDTLGESPTEKHEHTGDMTLRGGGVADEKTIEALKRIAES